MVNTRNYCPNTDKKIPNTRNIRNKLEETQGSR